MKLDVTRAAEWERALDAVEAALGAVEILCNNAGVGQGRFADGREIRVAEMPEALWRMVLEINATGPFLGVRSVVPRMLARERWGHIVNTASTGGLMAPGGIAAYCASKFAVVGLSELLAASCAGGDRGERAVSGWSAEQFVRQFRGSAGGGAWRVRGDGDGWLGGAADRAGAADGPGVCGRDGAAGDR